MKITRTTDLLATSWIVFVFTIVIGAFSIASAQTSAAISTQLSPGDSGSSVSALQTFLAADVAVYPEGLVTGFYGDLTTKAVQRYQCKYGIVCQGEVSSTGYGRVGPATLAKIQLQSGGLPGGPVIGLDVNAPIINRPTVATSSNSATISWTTSEAAANRVMYGTTWPFLFATAPSVPSAGGFSQSATVVVNGLIPNTIYYYVPESVDASGNLQWSFGNSFRTNP